MSLSLNDKTIKMREFLNDLSESRETKRPPSVFVISFQTIRD